MRQLTPKTQLDTLKTEAKRWLKQLRAGDASAHARLKAAWPKAPDAPVLRDVQYALALEYGQENWKALTEILSLHALAALSQQDLADRLLQHAWAGDFPAAVRVLERRPEVAGINLATEIVTGDLEGVRRRLAENPRLAREKTGPHQWEPILYLCCGHLPVPAFAQNSLAIAEALLAAGADPRAEFNDGWDNSFTCLTGVIGQGEGVRPTHPRAVEMAELLIAAGVDPFDGQALYNTSIVADSVFWNEILWRHCEARGQLGRWRDLPNPSIGGNVKLSVLDYLLGNAVSHGHDLRAAWLVERGADPNGINSYSRRPHHAHAQVVGRSAMADHLVRLGATPVVLDGVDGFQAAALNLDRERAADIARRHPEVLTSPHPLMAAAGQGRAEAARLMLDLGVPPDLRAPDGGRALISAAHSGSIEVVRLLIAAGADIDARGTMYNASPLSSAVYFHHQALADFLVPLSRDVASLTRLGQLERLAAVFEERPDLVGTVHPPGRNLLFFLPDDEDAAAMTARFLIDRGVVPKAADNAGVTPEGEARRRGLDEAADIIAQA